MVKRLLNLYWSIVEPVPYRNMMQLMWLCFSHNVVLQGRINVVDLHQLLNVDLSHVEVKVEELLKYDKNLVLIQGDVIDM